ncbi:MAG: ubiquinol-cytochrome c reductase cytochrome c subunit [Actinomycetota bacterium]|nr:ubiquinol-cytochrome c reductase cytochrome c subunit [Actinomycetota bacterium]
MKRRGLLVLPLFLLLFLLGACSYFQGQAAPYRPAGGIVAPGPASGEQLYQRDCAWCHGNRGQGTANGPTLVGGGPALTDFMLSTGRMPVTSPSQKDALHRDPAYSPQDIAAIVAFVNSFGAGGPDIPVVDTARGNLAKGLNLYQANCAACHSTTGEGGALATGKAGIVNGYVLSQNGLVAPPLLKATPTQVAEAMRTGPPGMPVFGPSAFPDDQVDSIARYVVALQRAKSPGGFALGRIGPVAEGAVGWLVGLAILVLLTRWIGTGLPKPGHHGGAHAGDAPPGGEGHA